MRAMTDRRVDVLRSVWLFEWCSRRELEALAKLTTPLSVPSGRALTRQGDPGREFVVVMEGECEVRRNERRLAVLGSGSFFGEMSLLSNKPCTATVTTVAPSELLVFTRSAFHEMTATMVSVDRKLLAVVVQRLSDVEARFVPEQSWSPE